ncbi:MAG: cysteine desulfurase [Bdellovibrionales bacterium]|nr:cysteine desulfurase [Bdellovibrionales bacterium]
MTQFKTVYLDYNATTPTDPSVFEKMAPYFGIQFGNASSSNHSFGWEAAAAVKKGRQQVAELLKASPDQIIFTSGATESNNIAISGAVRSSLCRGETPHIITTNIEHSAVLEVAEVLKEMGAEVTLLPVDSYGQVSAEQVKAAIKPNTKIISIMMANNEIGTINPVSEIGKVAQEHQILFHTDAAQGLGKVLIDVDKMGIDLLSISGHKIYAPKGIGALYVRDHRRLSRVMGGGSQEKGLRPGTLNVPGIVGLGCACEILSTKQVEEMQKTSELQSYIIETVLASVPEARLNGHPSERLCNNVSFSFQGLSADLFALGLSGVAVSSSSACCSGSPKPSHVLKALGHSDELARSTVRIGIGRFTTREDAELVVSKICSMAERNRSLLAGEML